MGLELSPPRIAMASSALVEENATIQWLSARRVYYRPRLADECMAPNDTYTSAFQKSIVPVYFNKDYGITEEGMDSLVWLMNY